jgi:hypothetical protein
LIRRISTAASGVIVISSAISCSLDIMIKL